MQFKKSLPQKHQAMIYMNRPLVLCRRLSKRYYARNLHHPTAAILKKCEMNAYCVLSFLNLQLVFVLEQIAIVLVGGLLYCASGAES